MDKKFIGHVLEYYISGDLSGFLHRAFQYDLAEGKPKIKSVGRGPQKTSGEGSPNIFPEKYMLVEEDREKKNMQGAWENARGEVARKEHVGWIPENKMEGLGGSCQME